MKCAKCPLYRSWSNESDSGESCGLFGDGWDNLLQYEDASGTIVGCYVDHNFIKLVEREYEQYLQEEADSIEEWMLKEDLLWDPIREGEDDQ
jgi:hypothetical protein